MPTLDTLRLRRPRPGIPFAPVAPVAPVVPVAPVLLGADGERPPLDVDLTLLLLPLLNCKPTGESFCFYYFWLERMGSWYFNCKRQTVQEIYNKLFFFIYLSICISFFAFGIH